MRKSPLCHQESDLTPKLENTLLLQSVDLSEHFGIRPFSVIENLDQLLFSFVFFCIFQTAFMSCMKSYAFVHSLMIDDCAQDVWMCVCMFCVNLNENELFLPNFTTGKFVFSDYFNLLQFLNSFKNKREVIRT